MFTKYFKNITGNSDQNRVNETRIKETQPKPEHMNAKK